MPDLLLAVKQAVDEEKRRGRFVLTGSANLLLARTVSESLAGRASYVTLWPMTRRELLGFGSAGIWDWLLAAPPSDWADVVSDESGPEEDWRDAVKRGGFPRPALELADEEARRDWYDGYTRTYIERDLQDLASIGRWPISGASCAPPLCARARWSIRPRSRAMSAWRSRRCTAG